MKKIISNSIDGKFVLDSFLNQYPFIDNLGANYYVGLDISDEENSRVGAIVIKLGDEIILYPFKISGNVLILPSVFYDPGEDRFRLMNKDNAHEVFFRAPGITGHPLAVNPKASSHAANMIGARSNISVDQIANNTLPIPNMLFSVKQSEDDVRIFVIENGKIKRETVKESDLEPEVWKYGVPTDQYPFEVNGKEFLIVYLNGASRKEADVLKFDASEVVNSDSPAGEYQLFLGLDDKGVPRGEKMHVVPSVVTFPWAPETAEKKVLAWSGVIYDLGDQFIGVRTGDLAAEESEPEVDVDFTILGLSDDKSMAAYPFTIKAQKEVDGEIIYYAQEIEGGQEFDFALKENLGVPVSVKDNIVLLDKGSITLVKLGVRSHFPNSLNVTSSKESESDFITGTIKYSPDKKFTIIFNSGIKIGESISGLDDDEAISTLVGLGMVPSLAASYITRAAEEGSTEFEISKSSENIINMLFEDKEKKAAELEKLLVDPDILRQLRGLQKIAEDLSIKIAQMSVAPDNDPLYQAINMFKNITDRPPMAFLMQIGYINDVLDALAKDLLNAEFNDLDDDLIELLKNALDYLDRVNDLIKRWHEAKITIEQ